jgi:hypothetical protein
MKVLDPSPRREMVGSAGAEVDSGSEEPVTVEFEDVEVDLLGMYLSVSLVCGNTVLWASFSRT